MCIENTTNCPYGSEFISEFRKVNGEKLKTQDAAICGGTCLSHSTLKAKVRGFQVQGFTCHTKQDNNSNNSYYYYNKNPINFEPVTISQQNSALKI